MVSLNERRQSMVLELYCRKEREWGRGRGRGRGGRKVEAGHDHVEREEKGGEESER
jgi:hypothetical protein